MAHRDPETGQFVAGSGDMSGITYADHDVHWIRHQVEFEPDADSGPDTALASTEEFEITERGLDPDELAELRAVALEVDLGPGESPITQDEIGSARANIDAGFNLSGEEFLGAGGGSAEEFDVDDSGTTDFTVATKDTDEVGQVVTANLSTYAGYSDTTDGTGGASAGVHISQLRAMPGLTGTGPVVDAVDDWTSRIRLEVNNMVAGAVCDVRYGLYYLVEESESGRTRFGR